MIFTHHTKVYINHTDAGGIVYHANHLTFFENARREWLSHLGLDTYFFDIDGKRLHFVVNHATVDYLTPLFLDDNICVSIDTIKPKAASLIMTQSIYRQCRTTQKTIKSATATIHLVCVSNDASGIHPIRLPKAFIQTIHQQNHQTTQS